MSELLSKDDLKRLLKRVPEWELEGKKITRSIEFDDFSDIVDFINDLAEIVDDAGHHPDIDIRTSKVLLTLTSLEAGGLTDIDLEVAERIDNLVD